jgi:hypothetical protein
MIGQQLDPFDEREPRRTGAAGEQRRHGQEQLVCEPSREQ